MAKYINIAKHTTDLAEAMARDCISSDIQFVNNLPNKHICFECHGLLKRPMIAHCCNTHFCNSCLEDSYDFQDFKCPKCDQYGIEASYDEKVWNEILLLEVKCPHFHLGCLWTGALELRGPHINPRLSNCKYVPVKCTHGCGENLTRADLANHIDKFCSKRLKNCAHCYETGMCSFIDGEHTTECPIICIGDNLPFLKYTDEIEHLADCICPLCNKVMSKPLLVECCHKHYCASCIEDPYKKEETYNCPNCNKYNTSAISAIQKCKNILSLYVTCPFSSYGCDWKGTIRKAGVHITKYCDYLDTKCPNNCGKIMKNMEIHEHLTICGLYDSVPHYSSESRLDSDDEYQSLTDWLPDQNEHQTAINVIKPDFLHPPLQEYMCLKCTNVMEPPMLTACCSEHFCATCLTYQGDDLIYSNYMCPNCNKDTHALLNTEKWTEILKLEVKCPSASNGCLWIGELKSSGVHSAECYFAEVVCRNECGEKLPRCKLAHHMGNYCSMRQVQCKFCNKPGEFKIIDGPHIDECPDYLLPCPNQCGVFRRQFLEQHLLECPEMPLNCDFGYFGCKELIKRKNMLRHIQEDGQNHLYFQQEFFKMELDKKDHQLENMVRQKNEQIERLHQVHSQQLSNLIAEKQTNKARSAQNLEKILKQLKMKYDQLEINTLQIVYSIDKIEINVISLAESVSIGHGTYKDKKVLIKKYTPATSVISSLPQEVKILMKLRHANIIELHGIVTTAIPMHIILEYMPNGNLSEFLKENSKCLLLHQQIMICTQIANAMDYVHQQFCMHGKLQATSIHMGEALTCKVGDFSSSRLLDHYAHEIDCYETGNDSIKLLPPEVLKDKKCSLKSDIWSFGLLIWDVATNARQEPYQGLPGATKQIPASSILRQPISCPDSLYRIIMDCLHTTPMMRPTFEALTDLLAHVKDSHTYAEVY